ncbi:MAG: Rpn family recombination-promoting nuclease/putative transposase [Opitutaceae bacterium]|jgi:hypothetical protein|nr:Rpn family recombination-promoting nuclease/putative transposase [Opitutaceae bacterium]
MTSPDESVSGEPSPTDADTAFGTTPDTGPQSAATATAAKATKANSLHQPHDKLFKTNFRDIPTAIAFFRNYLPARIVRRLDFTRIKVVPGSHIDGELKASESDLLFRVGLKNSRKEAMVYLLFEHQYGEDRWIALRLLRYEVSIWETWLKEHRTATRLPVIVPVVLAHNKTPWTIRPHFDSLLFDLPDFDNANAAAAAVAGNTDDTDDDATGNPNEALDDLTDFIPAFTFRLLQLAQIPFDKIMGTPLGILTLRIFKAQRLGGKYPNSHWIWDEALIADLMPLALEQILTYMAGRHEFDMIDLESNVAHFKSDSVKHITMTIAQRYIQKGRLAGREEGREEGRLEEQHNAVIGALETRFDRVPEGLQETIQGISDLNHLRQLHRAAILCTSIEDFAQSL